MLEGYYEFSTHAFTLVRVRPHLLADCVVAWGPVAAYARAMLDVAAGTETDWHRRLHFPPSSHKAVLDIAHELRQASPDARFHAAVDQFEAEFKGYVNLTPRQALERLRLTMSSKSSDLVVVRTYSDQFAASVAKSVLDAAGIECMLWQGAWGLTA